MLTRLTEAFWTRQWVGAQKVCMGLGGIQPLGRRTYQRDSFSSASMIFCCGSQCNGYSVSCLDEEEPGKGEILHKCLNATLPPVNKRPWRFECRTCPMPMDSQHNLAGRWRRDCSLTRTGKARTQIRKERQK